MKPAFLFLSLALLTTSCDELIVDPGWHLLVRVRDADTAHLVPGANLFFVYEAQDSTVSEYLGTTDSTGVFGYGAIGNGPPTIQLRIGVSGYEDRMYQLPEASTNQGSNYYNLVAYIRQSKQ